MALKGWIPVSRKLECPICHRHSGLCMVSEDGSQAVCMRVESDIVFSSHPSYLHRLTEKVNVAARKYVEEVQYPRADDLHIHQVWSLILQTLKLSEKHLEHLTTTRGLTAEEIGRESFKSFDPADEPQWAKIFKDAGFEPDFWKGVFGLKGNKYNSRVSIQTSPGILIPFRNSDGMIVGMQNKIDFNQDRCSYYFGYKNSNGVVPKNVTDSFVVEILYIATYTELLEYVKLDDKAESEYQSVKDKDYIVRVTNKVTGEVLLNKVSDHFGVKHSINNKIYFKVDNGPKYIWVSAKNGFKQVVHQVNYDENWDKTHRVIITEGGLKAEVIMSQLRKQFTKDQLEPLGTKVLAIAGVGQWQLAVDTVKELGIKKVTVAFDADFKTNKQVFKALSKLEYNLLKNGVDVCRAVWNDAEKGLDDLLMSNKVPTLCPLKLANK